MSTSKYKIIFVNITLTIIFGVFSSVANAQVPTTGWPMVAANPARTGWGTDQAQFKLNSANGSGKFVEWYRWIEAYIPNSVHLIAANDLIYVSSSRGLYALQYDTGQLCWRYDSDMPLGNSPTIATINGVSMAFVGGYDKKLHAFNATTPTCNGASVSPVWSFDQAKAGYDSNPLVINNTVYIGNRDGYFYAINAQNGNLVWQYPQANQDEIGPIHQSPAYKNGTIYFVTGYNHAYALNASNGANLWHHVENSVTLDGSKQLPGMDYNSYWPVVYTDPATNKDYAIFSATLAYKEAGRPGTKSYNPPAYDYDSYYFYRDDTGNYGTQVTLNEPWAAGKTILDFQLIINYYQQKPWQKFYTILDGTTGDEYSVPFPALPIFNPSSQYPPIIGPDGLIYVNNLNHNERTRVMGWKFGTRYFALTGIDAAFDEPLIISGGGNSLYRNHCCFRIGDYVNLNNLLATNDIWPNYDGSLEELAPGYNGQIFYLKKTVMSGITAQFGSVNGVYGYHGDQNQIISYKDKAYVHRGNSIIAFGTGTDKCTLPRTESSHCLPTITANPVTRSVTTPSDTELKSRLEKQIQKILSACVGSVCGLLKPGYYEDGMFVLSTFMNLDYYFESPGDTIYTMSIAYPYLSTTLKTQVKNFLKNTFLPKYDYLSGGNAVMHFRTGWVDGLQRDSGIMPPEIVADYPNLGLDYTNGYEARQSYLSPTYAFVNPHTFYALYKYAQNISPEDVQNIYLLVKTKLTTGNCDYFDCLVKTQSLGDAYLIYNPLETNAYIAGLTGFLGLQTLANQTGNDAALYTKATNELNRLKALRANNFSKDTVYTDFEHDGDYQNRAINISRNFMMMTPELGSYLKTNKQTAVQQALNEYNTFTPYWFVSRFNAGVTETGFQNLYDYPSNFQARAMILNNPTRESLYRWLDVPAFERGDLFYIQNLVATIEAPSSGTNPTPTPQASTNPSPSPSYTIAQLKTLISNWLGIDTGYYFPDGKINAMDASWVIKWLRP